MPKSQEVKQNKVLEILTTEYPFERILMGVLGVVVTVLGVYLIQGDVLTITNTDAWWNAWLFGTDAGILGFSIFILVIGVISFFVAIWPFFQPSFVEMKKVSWPNGKTIRNHSARVFGFIILLGLVFVIYDLGLQPLFDWLMSLGG